MISTTLYDLEKSVDNADSQLNSLSQKLCDVEKTLTPSEVNNVEVMQLLDSVTDVKNEYLHLRKEIQEVQQLQREMSQSLRYQLRTMSQTFQILKKKIEANPAQFSGALQASSNPKLH